MSAAAHIPVASSGSFLITPNVGLMIWVLVVFGIVFFTLRKYVFPVIGAALDARAKSISDSIDSAEDLRKQADEVLIEYRQRLAEARTQADEIVTRARQAGDAHQKEVVETARAERERLLEQTRRDVDAETRRAIDEIRREVADLTVLATEKVTRKALNEDDQRRLVEEALERPRLQRPRWRRGLAAAKPAAASTQKAMEEIAQVYARSLFEVASEQDKLDTDQGAARRVCGRAARQP